MRWTVVLILPLLLLSACNEKRRGDDRPACNSAPLQRSDSDNGLTVRLSLDKAEYKAGDWITATTAIENTSDAPLAVHFIALEPMQVTKDECAISHPEGTEMLWWRYAYYHPIVLEWDMSLPAHRLSWMALSLPEAEVKQGYEMSLGGARFGEYYPSYTIPPHSTILKTVLFEAKPGVQYIDFGLFSLKSFYSQKILAMSDSKPGSGKDGGVKFFPRIWIGSLYVKLDVRVK